MKTRRQKIIFKLLVLLITYCFIELVCFLFITTGYIPAHRPTFKFVRSNTVNSPFVAHNRIWGNWHWPGRLEYQDGCIRFDYSINRDGARDRERTKTAQGKPRTIVLGDSFMEGWGVLEEERMSGLLEKKTGQEFLNFGCATFGLTQSLLVYRELASKYEHETLLIGFLPFNDFTDDDIQAAQDQNFYRPFYVATDSGYQLTYKGAVPSGRREIENSAGNSFREKAVRFLKSFTWWYNIVSWIRNRDTAQKEGAEAAKPVSYYYDFKEEQMQRLKFLLASFRKAAGKRSIILLTIALPDDLRRIAEARGISPLTEHLQRICREENIQLADMAGFSGSAAEARKLFFDCDPHWNPQGHALAADAIYTRFWEEKQGK